MTFDGYETDFLHNRSWAQKDGAISDNYLDTLPRLLAKPNSNQKLSNCSLSGRVWHHGEFSLRNKIFPPFRPARILSLLCLKQPWISDGRSCGSSVKDFF